MGVAVAGLARYCGGRMAGYGDNRFTCIGMVQKNLFARQNGKLVAVNCSPVQSPQSPCHSDEIFGVRAAHRHKLRMSVGLGVRLPPGFWR